jgi:hypothetical protein
MRRFIITGLGGLATVAMSLGPASPAKAVIVPPGSVTDQVCNGLPAGLVGVLDQLAANGTQTVLAESELTAAANDLALKSADLVIAIVAHVATIDAGGNVVATGAVVSARASAYADAAARWNKASKDLDSLLHQGEVLAMQDDVLTGIGAGLCGGEG